MFHHIKQYFLDLAEVCSTELRRIFSNTGVLMVFFVAGIGYPVLFNLIYQKENLEDVPVAVVDEAQCAESRRFIHKLSATPEVEVRYQCGSVAEARRLLEQRQVNGIIFFPADYAQRLNSGQQARLGVFCDMSSFLYYKNLFMSSNFVMLDEMKHIELTRYEFAGTTGQQASDMVTPVGYNDVKLFVPGGGFTSFLIPALLVLVIHQTLFFGIGMMRGQAHEEGTELTCLPERLRRRRAGRVVLGRAMAYLIVYAALSSVVLLLIPRVFNLPHIGHTTDLLCFFLPFLLSAIFFSMACSHLVRTRESGIVNLVFFSIILLFLSGFAWPQCSMPAGWRLFSYIFPSSHAIQGFVRISSMGGTLDHVQFEYLMLWALTAIYFVAAWLMQVRSSRQAQ